MIKYKLDYNTWRCGSVGCNKLGKGGTWLLNSDGFSCCLGQFAMQAGIDPKQLLDRGKPNNIKVPGITLDDVPICTKFSNAAIRINDDPDTTVRQKVYYLKDLALRHDIEIEFVNFPEKEIL